MHQQWSASIYFYSHQQYLTPINLYRKFQQQQQSDTLIETHTVTADVEAYCTLSLHDHIMGLWEHVESKSNSEHLQLPEPNP